MSMPPERNGPRHPARKTGHPDTKAYSQRIESRLDVNAFHRTMFSTLSSAQALRTLVDRQYSATISDAGTCGGCAFVECTGRKSDPCFARG